MMPIRAGLLIDIDSQHKWNEWLDPLKRISSKFALIRSLALEKTVYNLRHQQIVQLFKYLRRSSHTLPHIQRYEEIFKYES